MPMRCLAIMWALVAAPVAREPQRLPTEMETLQREIRLALACDECQHACRVLGSMERVAVRVCARIQGGAGKRRCDEAKEQVYSARDSVKEACHLCEGGPSVERTAPIPSRR
jgi:hypothetical protein